MPEWVKNASEKPIPERITFTREQEALLENLQSRAHLKAYDDKRKRYPLCHAANCREEHEHEADVLARMTKARRLSQDVQFRGVEIRFAPGAIVRVPDGHGRALVATCPEKLVLLRWEDIRDLEHEPPALRFQTRREALEIIANSDASQDDAMLKHGAVTIEVKDGQLRYGDSSSWTSAPTGLDPDIAAVMTRVH